MGIVKDLKNNFIYHVRPDKDRDVLENCPQLRINISKYGMHPISRGNARDSKHPKRGIRSVLRNRHRGHRCELLMAI